MKRIIALTLLAAMLLAGCGKKQDYYADTQPNAGVQETQPEQTQAETTEETTAPTTEPAPVYYNPLNGEILDAPFTGRIFANTISNIRDAIPHVGVNQADMLVECFVNNSIVRCLALYTDIESVEAIGSTRSTRLMFNDLAQHYSLILTHAGGSGTVIGDANSRGIVHYNIDSLDRQGDELSQNTAYRDTEYGRGYEHCLFGNGPGIKAYAESQGVPMTLERDYGFLFTEDGTPANGEDAQQISVVLTYENYKKETIMRYDETLGKYVFYQYDQMMTDQITEEPEAFQNVVVMYTQISKVYGSGCTYFSPDFVAGGTGYFACGGKIIPMTWTCDGEEEPFRFFTEDGQPLPFGQGNTYIAICAPESPVTWGAVEEAEA